jgi:hypothetical protein
MPSLPGLGRRPTDPARYAHTIRLPLTGVTPPHPLVADHLSSVPEWMMGGNQKYGTCGPTDVANSAVLTWWYLLGEQVTVTDADVFDLYRRSGNPTFDPAGPPDANGNVPGDNGVDMTVMFSALVSGGVWITRASGIRELVKPYCFAAHPVDIDTVRAVTSIFGCSHLAVDLDVAQQGQATLWDYVARSGVWGGHAVPGGAYTSSAAAATADETVLSWQTKIGTTDLFIAHQLSEAYVVVWPILWDHPAFQAGVDRAALAAAYTAETGKTLPVPVPPAPVPPVPPAPVPPAPVPPAPGDIHADAADRAFAAALPRNWPTERHTGHNEVAARAAEEWLIRKRLTAGG